MTEVEAREQIEASYLSFVLMQAGETLRRIEAQRKAAESEDDPILYRKVNSSRVPARKQCSVESLMDLLYSHRPELKRAGLHWFADADTADTRLWKQCQQRGDPCPFEHATFTTRVSGLYFNAKSEIWLHSNLDGERLVEVTCHEFQHHASGSASEDDAKPFGLKAARVLAPAGGLFLAERYRHLAQPGDAILDPHGDRKWVRTLDCDGGWRWHHPLSQFELYVSAKKGGNHEDRKRN